jgi:hypothetical protein
MSPVDRGHYQSCISTAQSYLALAAAEPDRAMDWLTETRIWLDRAEKARAGTLGEVPAPVPKHEPRSPLPSRRAKPDGA